MQTDLKKYRVKNGLTQRQVADRAGLQENAYQRYEYGKTVPNVLTAMRVADILNTEVKKLWFPPPNG